jgi:hypothetical protein
MIFVYAVTSFVVWLGASLSVARQTYRHEYEKSTADWIRPEMGEMAFRLQRKRCHTEAVSAARFMFIAWPIFGPVMIAFMLGRKTAQTSVSARFKSSTEKSWELAELERETDRLKAEAETGNQTGRPGSKPVCVCDEDRELCPLHSVKSFREKYRTGGVIKPGESEKLFVEVCAEAKMDEAIRLAKRTEAIKAEAARRRLGVCKCGSPDCDGTPPEGTMWCTSETCVYGPHTGPRHLVHEAELP